MGSTGDSPPEKKAEEGEGETGWQPRDAWAQLSLRPAGHSQWVAATGNRDRIFIASARRKCRALAQKGLRISKQQQQQQSSRPSTGPFQVRDPA